MTKISQLTSETDATKIIGGTFPIVTDPAGDGTLVTKKVSADEVIGRAFLAQPTNPKAGTLFYDSGELKIYSGTSWISAGSGGTVKAFASFNGVNLTIHSSYNVSSVADGFGVTTPRGAWDGNPQGFQGITVGGGAGEYQVNFTTPITGNYSATYTGSFTENAVLGSVDMGGNYRKCDHCICGVNQSYVQFGSYGSYSSGSARQNICNIVVVG